MHLTAMGAGLLLQGKGGLRKPRVRQCLVHLNSFTQQERLGSLHRLELLHFCSMIFGYELSIKGGGGRRFAPQAQTCFSHAPSLTCFGCPKVSPSSL